jgi:hypothetical protein
MEESHKLVRGDLTAGYVFRDMGEVRYSIAFFCFLIAS